MLRTEDLRWLIAIGVVLCIACGEDTPEPTPAPEPEARPAANMPAPPADDTNAEREPSVDVRIPPRAPPVERPSAAQRRRVRELVREGRALARGEEPYEAILRFEQALEITPRDPRLHCELGYLALDDEDASIAWRHLDRGLELYGDPHEVPAPLREPLAMCLYNMGRVHERNGEGSHALDRYRDSLRLRDNATVRQHLETVTIAGRDWGSAVEASSIQALARGLTASRSCVETRECESFVHRVTQTFPATADQPETAWTESILADGLSEDYTTFVVLHTAEGYRLFSAHQYTEDNTDHGVTVEGGIRPGAVRRLSNGWLRFDYEHSFTEGFDGALSSPDGEDEDDCYAQNYNSGTGRAAVLCRLDGRPTCARIDLGASATNTTTVECEGGSRPDWVAAWIHEPLAHAWEVAVEANDQGEMRLHVVRGDPDTERFEVPLERWMSPDTLWQGLEQLDPS